MVTVAVFASGAGSNFENIVLASQTENLGYTVALLIVDKERAFALERAKELKIPSYYINPRDFTTKLAMEKQIVSILQEYSIDYIVLAGYMRILSETLLKQYPNKIINIHPSYLPEFPGKNSIEEAFKTGVKQTGVTIHYVDSGIDTGEIISQERLTIDSSWSLNDLEKEIHFLEHRMYPQVLKKIFGEKDEKSSY